MTTPRPTTYGEHAELAASALTRLIAQSSLPTDPADIDLMLRYRDAVVDSFRQRLHDLGSLPNVDRQVIAGAWAPHRDDLIPTMLAAVASSLPKLQEIDGPAPTDVFARRSRDMTVDHWRTAALESLAASNALSSDVDAWTSTTPEARWLVLRDLAVGLESLVLLDDELREVGLLNKHDAPRQPANVEDVRAVLAHAARISTWRATTDIADGLAPDTRPDLAKELRDHGPVRLVRNIRDLAAAETRLADALRPMAGQNSGFTGEPHLSARTARHVVIGQLMVTYVSQQILVNGSDNLNLQQRLQSQATRLSDIDRQLSYLVDQDPQHRMAGSLVYWQQSEITTSLQRLSRNRELAPLTRRDEATLEDASRSACLQLATSLRRELLREDSNLRLADPSQQVGPTRVHRRSPLERALTELVNASGPLPHQERRPTAVQRAVLQQTVDTTPTPTTRQAATHPVPARHH